MGLDTGGQAARVGGPGGGDPGPLRRGGRAAAHPPELGRVYAAYGGIFIALALLWGIVVDGFRPNRWDLLGATIAVAGVVVMVVPQRGG